MEERASCYQPNLVRVTNRDAATRQLKCAIRLFLSNEDVLVVHAAASASAEIFRGLLQARGEAGDRFDHMIRPERMREFRSKRIC
jgi:hypothetical protein